MSRILGFCIAALLLTASRAEPCVLVVETHKLDPTEQALDFKPPNRITAKVARIMRGHGPIDDGFTSCDDLGTISIQLHSLKDNRTQWQDLGFRVVILKGAPPKGFRAPADVLGISKALKDRPPTIDLVWGDKADDDQESFDFTLGIKAVDRAGNESRNFTAVRVRHPGSRRNPEAWDWVFGNVDWLADFDVDRSVRLDSIERYLLTRGDFDGDGAQDVAHFVARPLDRKAAVKIRLARGPSVMTPSFPAEQLEHTGVRTVSPGLYQPACARRIDTDCSPDARVFIPSDALSVFIFEGHSTYFWFEGGSLRSMER